MKMWRYLMGLLQKKITMTGNLFRICVFVLVISGGNVFASGGSKAKSKPVKVWAKIDRHSVTIGDKIRYTLVVKSLRGIEVRFPQFVGNPGGLAVRDFGSSIRNWWFFKVYKKWYVLDTYTSGDYTIPACVIKYRRKGNKAWHKINVKALKVKVKSVLKSAQGISDIRDIYPPLYYSNKKKVFIIAVLVFLLVFSFIAWRIIANRNKAGENIPRLKAHEIAYKDLEELKNKDYISRGEFETYFTELSDIVRHYLENRFDIRAPEMTTEEFLNALRHDRTLSRGHKDFLKDFLSHCDLVKFARYESNASEARKGYDAARNLINQTKEEPQDGQITDNKDK